MAKLHQGFFNPKNPIKYRGRYPIAYRSSWELKMMQILDGRPDVLNWSCESIIVPYYHPFKRRVARYYPDFTATMKNKEGKISRWVLEVKPLKETQPPVHGKRAKQSTKIYSEVLWTINQEKWKAAEKYCQDNGMKFKLLTEKEIYVYK